MMPLYRTTLGYSLNRLLDGLIDRPLEKDLKVTGLNNDSRRIRHGDMFLACAGYRTNGGFYIDEAVKAGAVAVLVEKGIDILPNAGRVQVIPIADLKQKIGVIAARFYGNPSSVINVIGVTGTNGKTTISYAIAQVMESIRKGSAGLIGTLGYGRVGHLSPAMNTTPDALLVQQLLLEMKNESVTNVIMEVSSHGLDQGRVSGIDFHTAVFTNLSEEHLDYHGDMSNYANAKKRLFLVPGLKYAVINTDDEYGKQLVREVGDRVQVIRYGLEETPDRSHGSDDYVSGTIREIRIDSLSLDVRSPWGDGLVHIRAGGIFNAGNFLASLSVLCISGIFFNQAMAELPEVFPVPGRIETFRSKNNFTVVVDYAHTPDALEKVLRSLREDCEGRLVCVFGCGGNRDSGKRPRMGRIAEQYADHIILTNDNPRTERPEAIIDEILAGMGNRNNVSIQVDRSGAISDAIKNAQPDDVILIAGKGHETYQEIGTQRFPFNDRQLVRNLLGDNG